jgi:glycosyltransferase involved in cell wall biosynthesis
MVTADTTAAFLLKKDFEGFLRDSRVLREARTLLEAGAEVIVFLYGAGPASHIHQGIRTVVVDLSSPRIPSRYNRFFNQSIRRSFPDKILEKFFFLFLTLRYYRRTFRAVSRHRVDIVHCHDFETLPVGYRLKKRLTGLKLVYDSHELWMKSQVFSGSAGRFAAFFLTRWEARLIQWCDRVITVNGSIADYLRRRYRIRLPEVLANYPLPVDFSGDENHLRTLLGKESGQKIVLYQGALIPGRGIEHLLRSFPQVDRQVVLVLMGYGQIENYRSLVARLSLRSRVFIFPPRRPGELLTYTRGADLGVSLTQNTSLNHYLSSPNKMWEYLMAGVPVLLSDFPEMRALAVGRGVGRVVDPSNLGDIARGINWFFHSENREEYLGMRRRCRILSRKEFNWSREGEKLVGLYSDLRNNSGTGR